MRTKNTLPKKEVDPHDVREERFVRAVERGAAALENIFQIKYEKRAQEKKLIAEFLPIFNAAVKKAGL